MRLLLSFLLLVIASLPALSSEARIGSVKKIKGDASIVREGTKNPAAVGDVVRQFDVLETGEGASMGVTFIDETMVSIGPDSQLIVDEYVFDPGAEEYSFVSRMARGTMFFVAGVMSKLSPDAASVVTTRGVIAIRGTRFMVRVDD